MQLVIFLMWYLILDSVKRLIKLLELWLLAWCVILVHYIHIKITKEQRKDLIRYNRASKITNFRTMSNNNLVE